MSEDMHILRSDDLGALIREYVEQSWQAVGAAVLEVLRETPDPERAAAMTPEDWIHQGYMQGAGHLIMALLAGEVRLELTGTGPRARAIVQALRRRAGGQR